jgi:hypothetical protein
LGDWPRLGWGTRGQQHPASIRLDLPPNGVGRLADSPFRDQLAGYVGSGSESVAGKKEVNCQSADRAIDHLTPSMV